METLHIFGVYVDIDQTIFFWEEIINHDLKKQ